MARPKKASVRGETGEAAVGHAVLTEGRRPRRASVRRETGETKVAVTVNIDGSGRYDIKTGIGMLDHFLSHVARHGLFDISVEGSGDLSANLHHLVEDVAICLGRAFGQALGERVGIVRMAHAVVPMDEALALVAVDIGGRGYAVIEAPFTDERIAELPTDLVRHFLESFAFEGRMNLHARLLAGANDHHKAEALFKALGRALDSATRFDERVAGEVPSTKGVIEK
ncbi:MAG: imidazoleglycerol-phosphate dehydratase HisB [Chloroflexi bacterium]|nr:imidazoleglycerol-phosphate dehydratase HisB [Chloroflexota bacterium]